MKGAVLPLLEYPKPRGIDVEESQNNAHDQDDPGGRAFEGSEPHLRVKGLHQALDFGIIHLVYEISFFPLGFGHEWFPLLS